MPENQPPKLLAGLSIQTACPCADGKYVRGFTTSFHNTQCIFIELGANVDFAELPGCADLGLARSKIFGNFLRSNHTHLLWIDSDMVWQPYDPARLILAKKDFIGAAGPKKIYPVSFAANNCDENGTYLGIERDGDFLKVTEVGFAFILLTKACVQKMADNYQDLKFPGDNNLDEYAVFDSFIIGEGDKKRRLSEDFSFCWRWNRIGGEIFLMPDIRLGHVGTHTWEGALIDQLTGTTPHEKKT